MGPNRLLRAARIAAPLLLLLLTAAPAAHAAPSREWLVGTGAGAHVAAALPGSQVAPGIRVVRAGDAAMEALRDRPGIRWVEPNRRFRASALAAPSDPLLRHQWALRAAHVPSAWWTSVGGAVTVAVLDSGLDATHPDLAENVWTNPDELPGNGVDDDLNGFVDDVHGADVANEDGDPADGFGHGTAVAGVIGARGGNGVGISGVAQRVRLLPVKVLYDGGWGTTATLVAGLHYALSKGARVVNMSTNGSDRSLALEEAIAAAESQGVLVVASAGNDGANRDIVPSYPASVASPAVLSVTSTDRSGRLAYASAYGATTVDLAAPGDNVLTTELSGRYTTRSGTSFAAAYVSGAAALIAAARPAASGAQLSDALVTSARRGGHLDGRVAGGQLDVGAAMRKLVPGAGPHVRLARRLVAKRGRPGRGGRAARPAPRYSGAALGRAKCVAAMWRAAGDVAAIAAYRVVLRGRRPVVLAAASLHRGRRCRPRLHRGRNRLRVTALDSSGESLASFSLTVRVRRPGNRSR